MLSTYNNTYTVYIIIRNTKQSMKVIRMEWNVAASTMSVDEDSLIDTNSKIYNFVILFQPILYTELMNVSKYCECKDIFGKHFKAPKI